MLLFRTSRDRFGKSTAHKKITRLFIFLRANLIAKREFVLVFNSLMLWIHIRLAVLGEPRVLIGGPCRLAPPPSPPPPPRAMRASRVPEVPGAAAARLPASPPSLPRSLPRFPPFLAPPIFPREPSITSVTSAP